MWLPIGTSSFLNGSLLTNRNSMVGGESGRKRKERKKGQGRRQAKKQGLSYVAWQMSTSQHLRPPVAFPRVAKLNRSRIRTHLLFFPSLFQCPCNSSRLYTADSDKLCSWQVDSFESSHGCSTETLQTFTYNLKAVIYTDLLLLLRIALSTYFRKEYSRCSSGDLGAPNCISSIDAFVFTLLSHLTKIGEFTCAAATISDQRVQTLCWGC